MPIQPHPAFQFTRADEVAECWDGVSADLYAALWSEVVPHQRPVPNLEDSGPFDHVGHESLASHWHRLSEAHQRQLNTLAAGTDPQGQCPSPTEPNPNPFARITAYSTPTEDGGVSIDHQAMLLDLITVFKIGGLSKETLQAAINAAWDEIEVQVIPATPPQEPLQ